MPSTPLQIAQVLLLFDEKNSADYGLALWAALLEAEACYNSDEKRLDISRFYISPHIPTLGFFGNIFKSPVFNFLSSDSKNALDLLKQEERVQAKLSSDEVKKP